MIPAKLWKATLEIKSLVTFILDKGSYCIREITKNSICSIYIQQKFKHNRTGISIPKVQFNSSNTEKMLFVVPFTYKK